MTAPVKCNACGHVHAGRAIAHICIGCPCMVRPDEVEATRSARAVRVTSQSRVDRAAKRLDEIRKRGW